MEAMSTPSTRRGPALDGRALRSERSRRAIHEALFALVGEGVLQPTAQQVADRAGVGIRTVFRHFEDMDALLAEIHARVAAEALPLVTAPGSRGQPRGARPRLVSRRAALFERVAPYKRSGDVQRWRSPFLRGRHASLVRELRAALLRWLPELEDAPPGPRRGPRPRHVLRGLGPPAQRAAPRARAHARRPRAHGPHAGARAAAALKELPVRFDNRVTRLLGVEIPIVQAPMGWIARSQLASRATR